MTEPVQVTHFLGPGCPWGATSTIKAAQASIAPRGRMTIVGLANGATDWSFFSTPFESLLANTY